jgi:hypothetical protein
MISHDDNHYLENFKYYDKKHFNFDKQYLPLMEYTIYQFKTDKNIKI